MVYVRVCVCPRITGCSETYLLGPCRQTCRVPAQGAGTVRRQVCMSVNVFAQLTGMCGTGEHAVRMRTDMHEDKGGGG